MKSVWSSRAVGCAAVFGAFFGFAAANAEAVLVQSGQTQGQGWVFSQEKTCWVATAGHVVSDNAGVLIAGREGQQAEGVEIRRHPDLDLAFVRIVGTLATHCPTSSLGDRDSRPELRKLLQEGRTISLEKRVGGASGDGAFGTDIVPVEVVAISESASTFTIRPLRVSEDAIVQSDSGSPIGMRGTGVLEAGLPLGLVIADQSSVESGYVDVIRMDVVRASAQSLLVPRSAATPNEEMVTFSISEFSGDTPSSECGPSNLIKPDRGCGWRAVKGETYPALIVDLGEAKTIDGVSLEFAANSAPSMVILTDVSDNAVGTDRPCRVSAASTIVSCSLGSWKLSRLKIVLVGSVTELNSLSIVEKQ